jgi:DNA-binding transcriptional LysR family regulator
MNVSLRQFRAFLAVARSRSFTRASEQMFISQAGLSAMMRELELQLDCRLFDRTTRAVSLTDAGMQFLPYAQKAVAEIEAGAAMLSKRSAIARQKFVVAVTPVVALSLFPVLCAEFQQNNPDVTITIHDVLRPQVQSMVDSGEADVGFGAFHEPMPGLERVRLLQCALLYVCGPGMLPVRRRGARLPTLPWSRVPETMLFSNRSPDTTDKLIDAHLAAIGRSNQARTAYGYLHTAIGMAAAGQGSVIVPSYALPACRALGADVARLTQPEAWVDFHRITRRSHAMAPAVRLFVESLSTVAARLWEVERPG